MIFDQELELMSKKTITSAAVTSDAVELGKTESADQCVIVMSGAGLAGGTGISVDVETADDKAMTEAKTLATFPFDLEAGLLQIKIPYGAKRFIRLKATPAGTFTAGTLSANVAFGPQLAAR